MRPLNRITGRMAPLLIENVDTDQIIPARYLKTTRREGLGKALFANWRSDPDFVLNREIFRGASILLGGENFGSGSSREHAIWALLEAGFRAVISTRIADIFRNNALKNSLVAVTVDQEDFATLVRWTETDPGAEVTIDLAAQVIRPPSGSGIAFALEPFVRHRLLQGIDELEFLLAQMDRIERYEAAHP
jgi:3-isopropylmalate/(R)-2-methylmalate dehydratase small subunit